MDHSTNGKLLPHDQAGLHQAFDQCFDLVACFEASAWKCIRTFSSQSHKAVLGHDPESCNGDIFGLTHLYTKEFLEQKFPEMTSSSNSGAMADGRIGELQFIHSDGHLIPFEYRISQVTEVEAGTWTGTIIYRDITNRNERQRVQLEAAENEKKLALFQQLDTSFDLVACFEVSAGKCIRTFSSQSHKTVLGHEPESCNGDIFGLTHLYTEDELKSQLIKNLASFEGGLAFDGYIAERSLRHADGHCIWFELRMSRVSEVKAGLWTVTVLYRDITDRKERQRLQLEAAQHEIERAKDEEAVHTISHQLKNRFVALLGLVASVWKSMEEYAPQLLQDPHNVKESLTDLQGQIKGGIRVCMNESIARMIAHDQYPRTDTEFDLYAELQQHCGVRIVLEIDPDVPQRIVSDLNLILHIAENFTSNATKYRASGGVVKLHVKALPTRQLLLSVCNVSGEQHAELIKRFGTDASVLFEGGVSGHKDALSTRKGLSIVKKCAGILGGTVSLRFEETEVVASLKFTFSILPTAVVLPTSTLIASVDDDPFIRSIDIAMIPLLGVDVASAEHVRGATEEEILKFPEYVMQMEPKPTIVLLDLHLGVTLGTDLLPRLRKLGFKGKIVIKSANITPTHAVSYAACGADGVLEKGIGPLDINRKLAAILFGMDGGNAQDAIDEQLLMTSVPDPEKRRSIVDIFVANTKTQMDLAESAVREGAYQRTQDILHRVKGSSVYVGGRLVGKICADLCKRTMEQREWDAELVKLRDALHNLCAFLIRMV